MKIWNDQEVKALFTSVENYKQKGEPIVSAFSDHAKRFLRKPNSVRNYYYHEVDNLCKDKVRTAKLKIDLSKHTKTHFKNFDKVQEGDLFDQIDKLTSDGLSVRAACQKLSGGDLILMTRFQNKYQNMKRKLHSNLSKHKESAAIIPFKQSKQILSEADINSLFLGLVKLIKKNTQEEILQKNLPNDFLKNTLSALSEKTAELSSLKSRCQSLEEENKRLQTILHSQDKQKALKAHINSGRDKSTERAKRI